MTGSPTADPPPVPYLPELLAGLSFVVVLAVVLVLVLALVRRGRARPAVTDERLGGARDAG